MATEVRPPTPSPSPPRPPLRTRDRLLPRTVLGLSSLILFASLGAAFSGAVLYSYYQYKLDQNTEKVTDLAAATARSGRAARAVIAEEREAAKREIRDALGPLRQLAAGEEALTTLLEKTAPSVWFVTTLDETGQASVGSAVVVASDSSQSFLLTSFATVRAATRQPGPDVRVRKGDEELRATLWTWQEERDLALLIVSKPSLPRLAWVSGDPAVKLGERVFAISGFGGSGAAITQGSVADVFAEAVQHSAPIGATFRGGPVVNSNGEVVGVASTAYAPLGFTSGEAVTFAVPIRKACDRVLRCPGGDVGGAGQRGGQPGG